MAKKSEMKEFFHNFFLNNLGIIYSGANSTVSPSSAFDI